MPDLPPSSPWRTSPYSDEIYDFEEPLNDLPRELGRSRPPTPHPSSSHPTLHPAGSLQIDELDDDTLPEPDEMEVARNGPSPPWNADPFDAEALRDLENLDDFVPQVPLDLESLDGGFVLEPESELVLPPPMYSSQPPIIPRNRSEEWQAIKTLIGRARGRLNGRSPPPNDRWGFAMTRGMTNGELTGHSS